MTPEQVALVAAVAGRAAASDAFADRFYERLFAAAPEVRGLFGDLGSQRQKLRDELAALVDLLGDLDALEVRAGELGRRHRGYGVRATQYRVARVAMAESLADVLGDDFGPAERAAWDRATHLVTELMQSG